MTRQSELKKRYDPEIGRYVKKNVHTGEIHGKGLTDILKSVGSKLIGKTAKEIAQKAAVTAATKTGEHLGNKAGDKIVELLSKKQPKQQTVQPADQPLTDFEIAQRVNRLISGGKIGKR